MSKQCHLQDPFSRIPNDTANHIRWTQSESTHHKCNIGIIKGRLSNQCFLYLEDRCSLSPRDNQIR